MRPEHPKYNPEWDDPASTGKTQMGIDQLKSMALAMGVTGKGDQLNPDSFAGTECKCHIIIQKGNDGKDYNRGRAWAPLD